MSSAAVVHLLHLCCTADKNMRENYGSGNMDIFIALEIQNFDGKV
jgi:hypothetical protein